MRIFLRAHGARLTGVGIEQARLLIDRAPALQNFDLPARFVLDRLHHEARGVDVLDLAARAPFLGAGAAHGNVHVGAHGAFLHVAVAGAERAHDGAQLVEIGRRFLGRAHVRPRDDLHQRDAGAIEIDERFRRRKIVDRLAGVLLKVQPLDADRDRLFAVGLDLDLALADDRFLVLADLIALRQVRIEIVLPVEPAPAIDLRIEAEAGADRLLDAEFVDHRQHARHRRIDQRDVRVGLAAISGAGAGEELGLACHLRVHFKADNDFPLAFVASDELVWPGGANVECGHGRYLIASPGAVTPPPLRL